MNKTKFFYYKCFSVLQRGIFDCRVPVLEYNGHLHEYRFYVLIRKRKRRTAISNLYGYLKFCFEYWCWCKRNILFRLMVLFDIVTFNQTTGVLAFSAFFFIEHTTFVTPNVPVPAGMTSVVVPTLMLLFMLAVSVVVVYHLHSKDKLCTWSKR